MGKGEKGSFRNVRVRRAQNIRKPGFAWAPLPCALSSDLISHCLCQDIATVSEAQDFAGEVGPLISPSTKDADRELGEGSAESNKDNSESRG